MPETVAASGTAQNLARTIAATHDLGLCPILADALQDAGCDDSDALDELRAGAVFGREPTASAVGEILGDILGVAVLRLPDEDRRTGRLRARTVSADDVVARTAARAVVNGRAYFAGHGGSVPNSCGYTASTEGVLVAAVYDHDANVVRVKVWAAELAANKVTNRGVAALFGFGDLCDKRVSQTRKDAARERLYAEVAG
jgi:hypothetical protein